MNPGSSPYTPYSHKVDHEREASLERGPSGSSMYHPYSVKVEHDNQGSLELGPFRQVNYTPPPPLPAKPRAEILTWPAYRHAEKLVKDVRARLGYNPDYKTMYVYIARKGFQGCHPSVVKFNLVEAHRFKVFLDHILMQISRCESRFQMIDLFKDNESRALESVDWKDRRKFWDKCDLNMFHLSMRVTFNPHYSDYEIHMLNRVSPKKQEQHGNWPGPYVCVYGTEGITKLRDFLVSSIAGAEKETQNLPGRSE